MHIPDGFLDTKVWLSTALLSAGAVAYSIKRFLSTHKVWDDRSLSGRLTGPVAIPLSVMPKSSQSTKGV
ncbi:MAG: hypothetical protein HPY71_12160 [Firmicutes bacterium]|nr:hypothetical protein [Bacillota bacterium]